MLEAPALRSPTTVPDSPGALTGFVSPSVIDTVHFVISGGGPDITWVSSNTAAYQGNSMLRKRFQ